MRVHAVFLVGFMGCGKTTVGQELARRLGWNFVDLDAEIEAREHQSIAEIFNQPFGERAFRHAETRILAELIESKATNCVIALGGGTFYFPKNRELLADWFTVFLGAPVDELWRRCSADEKKRPLAKTFENFCARHSQRLPFYRMATLTIETSGKTLPSICQEIENALRLRERPASLNSAGSDSAGSGSAERPGES